MQDVDKFVGPLERRTCALRNAMTVDPHTLSLLNRNRAAWYETEEEIKAGIAWGKRKAELLQWIRRRIGRRLTLRERRCVELYFFEDKNYREVGTITGTSASSCYRAIRRALRKLRHAAAEDGTLTRAVRRRRRSR